MPISTALSRLWEYFAASPVEAVAVLFSLAAVILTMREKVWCFPVGLVEVSLFLVVFLRARLYSDLLLQVVWFAMLGWGWWNWLHGGKGEGPLRVTRLERKSWFHHLVVIVMGSALLGWTMKTYSRADLPYWDALTTVLALTAQSLLNRKKLESWVVWIVVDLLWIGIYGYKGLVLTMLRTSVFLLLATMGWFRWRKSLSEGAEACSSESSTLLTADTSIS